jgi:hypothetical protein
MREQNKKEASEIILILGNQVSCFNLSLLLLNTLNYSFYYYSFTQSFFELFLNSHFHI